jgi:hypothetical protein
MIGFAKARVIRLKSNTFNHGSNEKRGVSFEIHSNFGK